MNWLSSAFIGLLTAVVSSVLSGFIANMAVRWYRMSSREGASGFFIIGMALLGLVGGFLVGVISSRFVSDDANGGGFPKGLAVAMGVLLVLLGIIAGSSRLLADVPPTIDGEELNVVVEVRYPQGHATSPKDMDFEASIELRSVIGGRARPGVETGILRTAEARLEEGWWVVPGAVPLFTERGQRVVTFNLAKDLSESFLVSLPRRPGKSYLEWSPWLPHPRPDGKPPVNKTSYRYRVQRTSSPLRTEKVGGFEIDTVTMETMKVESEGEVKAATRDHYQVRFQGKTVEIDDQLPDGTETGRRDYINHLGVVPGKPPALLAIFGDQYGGGFLYLLTDADGSLQKEFVATADGSGITEIEPGTAKTVGKSPLELNRLQFTSTSPILVAGTALVDPVTRKIHRMKSESSPGVTVQNQALGVSPDRRSVVRLQEERDAPNPWKVLVTDFVGGRTYTLPVDRSRMRMPKPYSLRPGWLRNHFDWVRDTAGVDQLVEKKEFKPMPYSGDLTNDSSGYREYRIEGGTAELRRVLETFLVNRFGGVLQHPGTTDFAHEVLVQGKTVNVCYDESSGHVSVFMDRGQDSSLVQTIAKQFDIELATGRHDALIRP